MNKEVQDKLDEFIESFLDVDEVKQYLLLKEELATSIEITALRDELKCAQKEMALSLGTPSYDNKKKAYLAKKREYENNPLIVNYEAMKEEVNYLIDELVSKLK